MPRQPTRRALAPAGPQTAEARSAAPVAARAPGAGQSARLRLLPGAGEPAREGARPLVVFFGVGDDRRSRVAAALLAFRARGRVQAVSMSSTASDLDPVVVRALADIGVDLLAWRPCPPSAEVLERASVVVVMGYDDGALDDCPTRTEDWFIDDPCGKDPETVRHLRDAIDRRVQRLLVRLGGAGPL
jgi:arsenate reductase (thioredoxin)